MKEDNEIWKDVIGYVGLYKVSSFGRVRSLNRVNSIGRNYVGKILSNASRNVTFHKNGKRSLYPIARLIYSHFNGKLVEGLVIDHIDNNPFNNHYTNLQQISQRENTSKDKFRLNPKSKYPGVGWNKKSNKWYSEIAIKTKRIHIGFFNSEIEARDAYLYVLESGETNKYKGGYTISDKVINKNSTIRKRVGQYDLNDRLLNVFNSITSAANILKTYTGSISRSCKMGDTVKRKWIFKYIK
jgi:hypothetical protein